MNCCSDCFCFCLAAFFFLVDFFADWSVFAEGCGLGDGEVLSTARARSALATASAKAALAIKAVRRSGAMASSRVRGMGGDNAVLAIRRRLQGENNRSARFIPRLDRRTAEKPQPAFIHIQARHL